MRLLTVVAVFLFAVTAHAGQKLSAPIRTIKKDFVNRAMGIVSMKKVKNGQLQDPIVQPVEPIQPIEPLEPLVPIRTGKLKWVIWKTSVQYDGVFPVISRAIVCSGESPAPVYDARTIVGSWDSGTPYTCQSTVEGQVVDITASGSAVLLQMDMMNEGHVSDYKFADTFVSIQNPGTSPNGYAAYAFGPLLSSRQIDVTSLAGSSYAQQLGFCSVGSDGTTTCTETSKETFEAFFEFMETP